MNNNYLDIRILLNGNEIVLNGNSLNNYVDTNSIRIQGRADWAFVRGGFKVIDDRQSMNKNIPPYTPCRIATIDDENNLVGVEYFCLTSEMTTNFTANKYIHDCTLLSLESMLECLILGSKSYTEETNYSVVAKSLALIKSKYNLGSDLVLDDSALIILTGSSDYTFGTGTTLYEVCKQVAQKTNTKFGLALTNWNTSPTLTIVFYNPTSDAVLTIDNTSNFLLNCKDSQNSDNYCKFLETEANNVVDRDNVVVWKNLTCRSQYVKMTDDYVQLILPTNVEAITKFEAIGSFGSHVTFTLPDIINAAWIVQHGGVTSWSGNYQAAINTNTSYGDISNIFQYFYDTFLYRLDASSILMNSTCTASYNQSTGVTTFTIENAARTNYYPISGDYTCDLTLTLLEEKEWNTKAENDRSHYLRYASGSNIIDNMNSTYRDNLWGLITATRGYNFLSAIRVGRITLDANNYCKLEVTAGTEVKAQDYMYNVEAVAITNPVLIDEKNSIEENETNYKPYSRSYQMGNPNGMPIYFDALVSDMDKQNETLGRIEKIVDIDTTNFVIPVVGQIYPIGTLIMPFSNQPVSYLGTTFYISSLEHRFTASRRYTQLNLTKTPYKIADAIGVDYQFNSLKIPMDNVIDRKLYFEVDNSSLYNNINTNSQIFINIKNSNHDLAKRAAISQDSEGNWYLYMEAIDNYSFDKGIGTNDSQEIVITDVPYSDGGKFTYLNELNIYFVPTLTKANSELLPSISALTGATNFNISLNKLIYKDTRERLTFTIKVKNPN